MVGEEYIYTLPPPYISLHCHHQNDFCIKMGSNERHFNVSVGSDGQSHKTVSTNHNLFEEKGEGKRGPRSFSLPTLSPFLIGRMFVREPSWKYSAKLVGS